MRAVVISDHESRDGVGIVEVDDPVPGENEVVVDVKTGVKGSWDPPRPSVVPLIADIRVRPVGRGREFFSETVKP